MTYVKAGALFSLLLVTELLPECLAPPLFDVLSEGGPVLVLLSRVCLVVRFKAGLVFLPGRDKPACKQLLQNVGEIELQEQLLPGTYKLSAVALA